MENESCRENDPVLNALTDQILKSAFKVHSNLGPGLLESSYSECLNYELRKSGLIVEREKPMPLIYDEIKLETGYRLDFLIENKVVIEIKAVECLNDIHRAQVLTYLKLSKCLVGLLLNFNVPSLRQGIRRFINKFH